VMIFVATFSQVSCKVDYNNSCGMESGLVR
jgi:hypothetical protein